MPLSRLNDEQYSAATSKHLHNLIIASAGTGKTSTIVGRIAYLLSSGIKPEEIMLVTFTNKAASEMIQRVSLYFGQNIASKIDAGTFHAIGYRWLKKLDSKITLKQQRELKTLFKSVYEKRIFSHLNSSTKAYGAAYLYDIYSFYQNTELNLPFNEWIEQKYPQHDGFAMIYADIIEEFESLKSEYGFVSFNDLLVKFKHLLQEKKLGIKEVLVDEYQDTNALQGILLNELKADSLFCVGDYDQSIYAFNGADISIIGNFTKTYPNAKVFALNKNYRSTSHILSLASKVINNNDRIYPKELIVTRTNSNEAPKLLIYDELFLQYNDIATKVKNSPTAHDDIAIIFRNNSSADGIEASLRELGIACKRKGGTSFFETREIKAILDIYSLLINKTDMMAFVHILEYAKSLGSSSATDIFLALKRLGDGDIFKGLYDYDTKITNPFEKKRQNTQLGLFDDMLELGSKSKFAHLGFSETFLNNPILKHPKLTRDGANFLYDFYNIFKELKNISSPQSIISKIEQSNLFQNIASNLAIKRATQKDGQVDEKLKDRAIFNIQRKVHLLRELAYPYKEHDRFLNAMILGSSDLTQGSGVNLLTIHASKGLEFNEVYIVDLMDGRFPNRKLMQREGSLEEERRLFYVAVTRAKDRLYLSYAKYDKVKKSDFVPSIFLYEASLLQKDDSYLQMMQES